ncbi:uncharacterized protein PFL1_01069 [Pseudozyma flocculosa PF-1]|uniref:Related to ATP20 - subunit G of mitochondrial F1F0-ATP Synthase n=1 Tax=Pseudozyma flocculosa TaxID=84751 RepID=A0A5C3FDW5_9BASI|nr:uncharacterized protein PFL1_01069 [Pseudozyma flocculosa PF-1]EPQ31736.1 hypothetical protein PFL1_01069 [Pseudozyma flocculosa PF-1]SPO41875.1 related to ATP20 - subunit G of mitochondrial F1F0-ATP Synthase [Pseudozyma flocculosa]
MTMFRTALRSVGRQSRGFTSSSKAAAQESSSSSAAAQKASNTLQSLSEKAQQIGGPVVKRVEGLLGGYSEPLQYNLKVAGSVAKQVYIAEGLAPPTSVSSITSAYRTIWSRVTDAGYWGQLLTKGQWKQVGIYAVEAYGIFTIGEMIGRRSLVGYKLDTSKHGHHGAHH